MHLCSGATLPARPRPCLDRYGAGEKITAHQVARWQPAGHNGPQILHGRRYLIRSVSGSREEGMRSHGRRPHPCAVRRICCDTCAGQRTCETQTTEQGPNQTGGWVSVKLKVRLTAWRRGHMRTRPLHTTNQQSIRDCLALFATCNAHL